VAKSDISTAQSNVSSNLGTTKTLAGQNLAPATAGYQNFATTGGISPQQQNLTEQQAQGTASSLYDAMNQNLDRQKAIQGGYSPGYGTNEAQLGRQGSAAASGAVNQANLGILQQIQQGKLQGLGGLAGIGSEYQSQVPQLLSIGSQLAQAKPSWQQELSSGTQAITGMMPKNW
jgi:hypothetical protein